MPYRDPEARREYKHKYYIIDYERGDDLLLYVLTSMGSYVRTNFRR